jgi:hypothetical protein
MILLKLPEEKTGGRTRKHFMVHLRNIPASYSFVGRLIQRILVNYHWWLHWSQTHQIPGTAFRLLPPGHEVIFALPHLGHFSGFFDDVESRTNLRSELSLTIYAPQFIFSAF